VEEEEEVNISYIWNYVSTIITDLNGERSKNS
jgi:hypothetical protein